MNLQGSLEFLVSMIRAPSRVSFEGQSFSMWLLGIPWARSGLGFSSGRRMGGEGWRWGDRVFSARRGTPAHHRRVIGNLAWCGKCQYLLIQKGKGGCLHSLRGECSSPGFLLTWAPVGREALSPGSTQKGAEHFPWWLGIRKAGGLFRLPSSRVFHASSDLIDERKSRVQGAPVVPCVDHFECICRG